MGNARQVGRYHRKLKVVSSSRNRVSTMQMNSFRHLIELERTGSINKAAKNLFISQQGLSKAIDSLEMELGIQLIERSHSGVQFTEGGQIFLQYAKSIAENLNAMQHKLDLLRFDASNDTAIDLVISAYTSITLLGNTLPKMKPTVQTSIHEWSIEKINEALGDGGHGKLYLFDWISEDPSDNSWQGRENKQGKQSQQRKQGRQSKQSQLSQQGQQGLQSRMQSQKLSPQSQKLSQKQETLSTEILFSSRFGLMHKPIPGFEPKPFITLEEAVKSPLVCFNGKDYLQSMDKVFGQKSLSNIVLKVSDQRTIHSFILKNEGAGIILDELTYSLRGNSLKDLVFIPFDSASSLLVGFVYSTADPMVLHYQRFISAFKEICAKLQKASK